MSRASSPTIETMPRKSSPSSKSTKSTQTKVKPSHRSQPANTLDLSDLHLRHAGLEKEHQKLLKQIKSKQSEIDKLQIQMREILQEIAGKTLPLMQELWQINERVHELFKDILTKRKLGKKSRQDIEGIYYSLQRSGIISPKLEEPDEDDEDTANAKFEAEFNFEGVGGDDHQDGDEDANRYRSFRDLFSAVPKIDRDEQKKIRHVFLRLAEIFHPDKCLDHDRADHYAEIMKEVNQAYAEGNLAKLLEIEKQHQLGQEIDINNEDSLLRNCDRLDQHNTLLKHQYENLKIELRLIKNTREGSMAVEYRKMIKRGINPIDEIVDETQEKLDVIVEIEDFVHSFHQKRITIKEFVRGPEVLQKMQMLALEEILFGTEFSMFDDEDDW